MPKQKTHKGLARRVKVSATGKVRRKPSFSGHLMSGKSGKRRRRLRKTVECFKGESIRILRKLNPKTLP